MIEPDQHSSPIKTPKQLVIVVVLAFVVPITLIVLITQLVTGRPHDSGDDTAVLARIAPVGTVQVAAPSAPKGSLTGEQVFQQTCKTCHEAGLAGAHKVGDKAAWANVVKQGDKLSFQHAIAGIRAMPPRGGNPELTDEEVQRGVVFMVNQAGANWKAPPVNSAATAAGAERSGEQVVAAACGKCHQTGERGAPRIGDRAAWIQREKRGLDVLYTSALRGHSGMPARGGMADLSDVAVKRAIAFMINSGAVAAPVATAATPPAAAAAAPAGKADGKKVYEGTCVACHGAGIAGAPKFGDKAAWSARLAQGPGVLHEHALKGFQGKTGVMPPKGGAVQLPDADIVAAVDYMAAAAK